MFGDFHDVEEKYGRYLAISAATGCLDYLLALTLLSLDFPPHVSLGCAIVVAGTADYLALEWWGFPQRKGALCLKRLAGSGLVELATYFVRLAVVLPVRDILPGAMPARNALSLAVAYATGFVCGYLMRSRIVFRK
jgi:putative flippase GtrA